MRRVLIISLVVGAALMMLAQQLVRSLALTEWRATQRRYNERQRAAGLEPIVPGIRELDSPLSPGQPERCVTCHLGTVLPDAHEPPFQVHPPLACTEPLSRLGCVACHRGQPLALTRDAAHGRAAPVAAARLLALREERTRVQAGCGRAGCHRRVVDGVLRYDSLVVPELARGLELFLARGCPACHRLPGVYHAAEAGPRLADVGLRLDRDALSRQLRRPPRPMPPVGLPAAELDALVSLLQAQTAEDRGAPSPRLLEHFDQPLPAASGPAVGAMWARRLGCVGCHRLGQNDGGVPDLRHVAWTTTADQLQQTLRRPGRRFPGTLMPPLQAPTVIVDSVVSYLELQKVPLPSAPAAVFRQVCGRCHGQQRDARWVVLSRSPPLLEPRPRIERAAFIDTAARGREGTAMPTWGRVLSRGFLGQIYDQLEAQR